MNDLLYTVEEQLGLITINREQKRNAFDNELLVAMQESIDHANQAKAVRVIVLKASGTHFSAGADLSWMKSMASFTEEDNLQDALVLGNLMHSLHYSPKPVIAMIQGPAFGGGAGIAAACSMAIASTTAHFCFSEVKLGLIPAVISPYVIKAMGERVAQMLFMSADVFDAQEALRFGLVQYCLPPEQLLDFTLNYAKKIAHNSPDAVKKSLDLVRFVANKPINAELVHQTAARIAAQRVSAEGQYGLNAFLNKQTPNWS